MLQVFIYVSVWLHFFYIVIFMFHLPYMDVNFNLPISKIIHIYIQKIRLLFVYIYIYIWIIFEIEYISMPSTSSYKVHLYAKYIFMPSKSSYQEHLHTKYTFIPSAPSHNVHLYTKYQSWAALLWNVAAATATCSKCSGRYRYSKM